MNAECQILLQYKDIAVSEPASDNLACRIDIATVSQTLKVPTVMACTYVVRSAVKLLK